MRPSKNLVFAGTLFLLGSLLLAADHPVPRYDHIVIVIEENHSLSQVAESAYLSSLASRGTLFTRSYAVAHPSQPNYLALFSGSTHGIQDDRRHDLTGPNLAASLAQAGLTFAGYSEDLPSVGFRGDSYRGYVRKHNPLASFTNVPDPLNKPLTDFPADFSRLPTVSFVVPSVRNDMHDGSVAQGDQWLRAHLDGYARWAVSHNSLLIVTFDEGSGRSAIDQTPIATLIVGAHVNVGVSDQPITHYSLLRMIEDIYGLSYLGEDASASPIRGTWD